MVLYALIHVFGYLILRRVPRSWLGFCGWVASRFMYMAPAVRNLVIANLKIAFPEKPDKEIRRIALASLSHLPRMMLEFLWIANRPDKLDKHTIIPDSEMEKIRRLQGKDGKRPVMYVCPHLGGWEVSAMMVAHWVKCPFASIAAKIDNPYLDKLIVKCRSTENIRVIPAKGAVRGMVMALKEGYSMGTLIDQNTKVRDGGIWVNYFGLPVPTSPAPAFFGKKFDIAICVGGAVIKNGKYEFYVRELPKPSGEYTEPEEMIQDLLKLTEDLVREFPEQYLWMYKRFKFIPNDISEKMSERYPDYAKIANERFYDKVFARQDSTAKAAASSTA